MKNLNSRFLATLLCWLAVLLAPSQLAAARFKGSPVSIPAGLQHDRWDALLKKYVNEKGLVAYERWKANPADRKELDDYLAQFAPKAAPAAKGDDLAASAINAYNAFAIHLILENYPTESIMALPKSFARKAHLVGGEKVALDDLEHGTLRPLIGYRAHAALVCCARSCPPLRRTAYTAAGLDEQINAAYTTWLAREDLNQFEPAKKRAAISSIFKWFKEDFDAAGGVPKILAKYAPASARAFLSTGDFKPEYLTYRWGLNDQGDRGVNYSSTNLIFDSLF